MPRDPRAFTQPQRLVEVTTVTIRNRYLLRPSAEVNDLILGVVGRAQRKYDIEIICLTVLSSHLHILLYARDPQTVARFMCYVKTNIAKELGAKEVHDWPGGIFQDRYHLVEVSDEAEDQIVRLKSSSKCMALQEGSGLTDRALSCRAWFSGVQSTRAERPTAC